MTRVTETEEQKPAQPRLGNSATGLARTELYASLLSTPRAVKVAAAPVSAIAETSSVGGPGGGIQNSWKPAGPKKNRQKGWPRSSRYWYESGSRQNNWRDTHQPGPRVYGFDF
eukprot:s14886_g1.t1